MDNSYKGWALELSKATEQLTSSWEILYKFMCELKDLKDERIDALFDKYEIVVYETADSEQKVMTLDLPKGEDNG